MKNKTWIEKKKKNLKQEKKEINEKEKIMGGFYIESIKEKITSSVIRTSMVTKLPESCLGSLVSIWIRTPSSTSTVLMTRPSPVMTSVSLIRTVSFTWWRQEFH